VPPLVLPTPPIVATLFIHNTPVDSITHIIEIMCGILGILLADENAHVNQMLFDGLTVLQHRGQDAAGIVTSEHGRLHLRKDNGLVKDVFQTHHMIDLRGNFGLGHVRYPTAGSSSCAEAQPLYTNYPHGVCVAHNGNLTNAQELADHCRNEIGRHINTDSDSEVLLNIFADSLIKEKNKGNDMVENIFSAVENVMSSCKGGYAGMYLINGIALVGFRDPHGIRPIVMGTRKSPTIDGKTDYIFASESVAIDTLGFDLARDLDPAEAIVITMDGQVHTRTCLPADKISLTPCIFEHVYFARPDSIMDGVSVYESRLKMGEKLAYQIIEKYPDHDIDVVIPIPDTSRTSAVQAAYILGRPYREGFIKNRYIARTFIMPGQETRRKSVRLKLNTIKSEFAGRNVLLVDDSVVRGTTATEIIQMARDAGARKVYMTSAAPPIRYPNIYGIDIPTRHELVAYERNEAEIAEKLGCDWIVYQRLNDLEDSVNEAGECSDQCELLILNQLVFIFSLVFLSVHSNQCGQNCSSTAYETSCFSGTYVTGESIDDEYFTKLHDLRNDKAKLQQLESTGAAQAAKAGMPPGSHNGCENLQNDRRGADRG
jgi:amidophosphoribosyltransferase